MRLTIRVATAATSGFMAIPAMPHPAEDYVLADGRLDMEAAVNDLRRTSGVLMSSDDNASTLAFTVELLDRLKRSLHSLMEYSDSVREATDTGKTLPAQRRFNKGRVSYVRVDIRLRGAGGFRAKLSAANPKGVVGHSEEFARAYAQAVADNLVALSDALLEQQTPVELQEGEGCAGVFEEARRRNDMLMTRLRHKDCPNRHNGYCSPSTPACELYHNGRCMFDHKPQEAA